MWKRLEALRPLLVVVVSIGLVMAGILIGSRLPGRDVTLRYPDGFPLDYAGAPADSFVPLRAGAAIEGRPGGPAAIVGGVGGTVGTAPPRPLKCRPYNPYDRSPQPCDESLDIQTQTTEYAAAANLGANGQDQSFGIGGGLFHTQTRVLSVKVEDDNGPGVQVIVCQGPGGGIDCGTRGATSVTFCSTSSPYDLRASRFVPGYFRVRVDTTGPACPTLATKGLITIHW